MKAIKSFLNAIGRLYSAWVTTSVTVEMNAETELLKAVKNKKEIDKYFADFDESEVEQVNQIIDEMRKKVNQDRNKMFLFALPILFSLLFLYFIAMFLLEILTIIFS